MRTIEVVRLENYRRVVEDLRLQDDGIKNPAIANALGLSTVYVWQLNKGARTSIDSKAARQIERGAGKPEGWMDTDHELWPFDAILLDRVRLLRHDDRMEIQGVLRSEVAKRSTSTKLISDKTAPAVHHGATEGELGIAADLTPPKPTKLHGGNTKDQRSSRSESRKGS